MSGPNIGEMLTSLGNIVPEVNTNSYTGAVETITDHDKKIISSVKSVEQAFSVEKMTEAAHNDLKSIKYEIKNISGVNCEIVFDTIKTARGVKYSMGYDNKRSICHMFAGWP